MQKPDGSGETAFSFDRVYGAKGAPFEKLYPTSVAPLVDGLFEGFSATAFAYGALGILSGDCYKGAFQHRYDHTR